MKTMNRYDMAKKNRANLRATFRGVVALYLLYIAQKMVKNLYAGATDMSAGTAWLIAAAFAAAAVIFGIYTWRSYRRDLAAAKLPDECETQDGV